jgi:hypothetical protein
MGAMMLCAGCVEGTMQRHATVLNASRSGSIWELDVSAKVYVIKLRACTCGLLFPLRCTLRQGVRGAATAAAADVSSYTQHADVVVLPAIMLHKI